MIDNEVIIILSIFLLYFSFCFFLFDCLLNFFSYEIYHLSSYLLLDGLQVIHGELESLPWQSFVPSLTDVEQLVRVTAQFLPEVHSFLVSVWVRCPVAALIGQWKSQQQQQQHPLSVFTRFLACLIHLYVRLAGEPTAQQVLHSFQLVSTGSSDPSLNRRSMGFEGSVSVV